MYFDRLSFLYTNIICPDRIWKKKINMNFTSYFLISFKHLKKIYIKCKYIHVIEKKTDYEMWETKVDKDWKKAKIKSPHIVFLMTKKFI